MGVDGQAIDEFHIRRNQITDTSLKRQRMARAAEFEKAGRLGTLVSIKLDLAPQDLSN